MSNRYEKTQEDFQLEYYHEKQNKIFMDEFEYDISSNYKSDEEYINDLKFVQEQAMNGIFCPTKKNILEEWKIMHPDRFDKFSEKLSDENRLKLYNFLHL